MDRRHRPALRGNALLAAGALAAVLGLAAAPAPAQTAPPASMADEPVGLRATTAATASRPAYRGRYPVVGRPVRMQKRVLQRAPVAPPIRAGIDPAAATGSTASRPPPLPPVVEALPSRRRGRSIDPYTPLGIAVGGLIIRPAIEQSVGYDTNPNRVTRARKGSVELRSEGSLAIESDWARHALNAQLRGAYLFFPSVTSANRPDADASMALRLDAARDTRVDLGANWRLGTERPGSVDQPLIGTQRSLVNDAGANAEVTQQVGRAAVSLRGSFQRTTYDPVRLANGREVSQADRDANAVIGRLRVGYDVSPGIQPYVEATLDRRVFDNRLDANGIARDSDGWSLRAGGRFEITTMLLADINAGYGQRVFDGPTLAPLRGPVADAAIIWTPSPLTTVTVRGTLGFSDSIATTSGSTVRSINVEVAHALRRNLTVTAIANYARTTYQATSGAEDGFTGGVRLEYRLTRSVAVRASFTHERLQSSVPGGDYTANVSLVGLRLQY